MDILGQAPHPGPPPAAQFDDATSLTLVCAPAGYGKSTLLAAWHREAVASSRRATWLSLDSAHGDPDVLATALPGAASPDGGPSAIFLDGFEHIAGTEGGRWLADSIARSARETRWIVATRIVPLRDLARLRAEGRVRIIDGAALRMTRDDYAAALGRPLTAHEAQDIDRRLEGWPLAIRALTFELAKGHTLAEALSRVNGVHGLVADYIAAELLPSLPADVAETLCQASILGTFDAATADLLSGRTDSHRLLAQLDRIEPLASRSLTGQWRLHPLLQQHLEHRFDLRGDIDVVARRTAAFELLAAQEDFPGAVRNALRIGRSREAARLIGDVGVLRLWTELGFETLLDIIQTLPPALAVDQPSLRFSEPLRLYGAGRTASAIRLLDTIRSDLARNWRGDPERLSRFELEWLAIRTILDLTCEVVREDILHQLPTATSAERGGLTDTMMFFNALLWAVAHLQWGEVEQADRMVTQAEQAAPANMAAFNGAFFDLYRGWIAAARGKPREAIAGYRSLIDAHEGADQHCLGGVMVAEALYMQGEFAAAASQIDRWLPALERSLAWFDFFSAGYGTAALLALRNRGLPAGLATIDRLESIARDRQAPSLLRLIPPLRLALLMRAGAWKTARALEADYRLTAACRALPRDRRASSWRERDLLRGTLAEFHIHNGSSKEARQCIQPLLEDATATGRRPAAIVATLLQAALLWRQGSSDTASAALAQAIEDAVAGDQRGLVWDRAYLIEPMLEPLRRERGNLGLDARALLEALIADMMSRAEAQPYRLTPREREIIAFVEAGEINKQIGRHLGISENTVKFHLKRIASKLGCVGAGRATLADAARRLAAIEP